MSLTTIEHYALLAYLRLLAFLFNDTILPLNGKIKQLNVRSQ